MVSMENIRVPMETIHGPRRESDLELHLGYWLRRASSHVSGAFARALQTRHTSVAEWVARCQVQERPGIAPGSLAEALDLTRGAVSKVIDKLEAKNWIARSAKPGDSRVQLLSLTGRGSRILPRLREIAHQNDREFFDGLEAGERATLRRLLGKLATLHQTRDVPIK
jgi:DNA-binding MarR family transcriptional regulator